jgi:UDP-N-acetylglucosamine 1-carboxyvinyltransferase
MSIFKIKGGNKLKGEIIPQGAKNEALQIVSAVLLTDQPVTIHNIPDILDVNKLIELVGDLGAKVEKLSKDSYRFTAATVNSKFLESEAYRTKAAALRGSVMLLGPILARFGKASLPKPGGDKIGRRRLDTHFIGFQKLGAQNSTSILNNQYFEIDASQLKGTYMLLDEASVTGTANIVMAAVLAKGNNNYLQRRLRTVSATTLQHAEPHGRQRSPVWGRTSLLLRA